eukprot:gene5590-9406_t
MDSSQKKHRIVCLADTDKIKIKDLISKKLIPDGNFFIHCGDFSNCGTEEELKEFNNHIGMLTHKYKIIICGNRDYYDHLNAEKIQEILFNGIYLQDSMVELEGIKFYGLPWNHLSKQAFYDEGMKNRN